MPLDQTANIPQFDPTAPSSIAPPPAPAFNPNAPSSIAPGGGGPPPAFDPNAPSAALPWSRQKPLMPRTQADIDAAPPGSFIQTPRGLYTKPQPPPEPTVDPTTGETLDFSGLQPAPPEHPDTGFLGALYGGVKHGIQGTVQTGETAAGQTPQPLPEDTSLAAQPWALGDVLHPKTMIEKGLYGLGESAPMLALGVAGGAAGTFLGGGPESPVGWATGLIGGALGAAAGTMAQEVGPRFAAQLQATPKDPDGAFDRALKEAGASSALSGAAWAAFGPFGRTVRDAAGNIVSEGASGPFKSAFKNLMFQAFGVQPAVSAAGTALQNVAAGQPAGQGVPESALGAVAGTAIPALGHEILRRFVGAGAAERPPGTPQPPQTPAIAAETPPPQGAPAVGQAVSVQWGNERRNMTVAGYRGDLARLIDENGVAHLRPTADLQAQAAAAVPPAAPSTLPAAPAAPPEPVLAPTPPPTPEDTAAQQAREQLEAQTKPGGPAEPAMEAETQRAEGQAKAPAIEAAQAATSATGLPEAFRGAGQAIVANLYGGLFDALKGVDNAHARMEKPLLARLQPFFEQEVIKTPGDIQKLVNAGYDPAKAGLVPEIGAQVPPPAAAAPPAAPPEQQALRPEPAGPPNLMGQIKANIEAGTGTTEEPEVMGRPLQPASLTGNVINHLFAAYQHGGIPAARELWRGLPPAVAGDEEILEGFRNRLQNSGVSWEIASGFPGKLVTTSLPQAAEPQAPRTGEILPPEQPAIPTTMASPTPKELADQMMGQGKRPQWRQIGENANGEPLFEDERGVRSILRGNIRSTEPVEMVPSREGPQISVRRPEEKPPEYQLPHERPAAPTPPALPAPETTAAPLAPADELADRLFAEYQKSGAAAANEMFKRETAGMAIMSRSAISDKFRSRLEAAGYSWNQAVDESKTGKPPAAPEKPAPEQPKNAPVITAERHTQTHEPIFFVRFAEKPSIEGLGAKAKSMGGKWSSFNRNGMRPGWLFKTQDAADRFAEWSRRQMQPAAERPITPETIRTDFRSALNTEDRAHLNGKLYRIIPIGAGEFRAGLVDPIRDPGRVQWIGEPTTRGNAVQVAFEHAFPESREEETAPPQEAERGIGPSAADLVPNYRDALEKYAAAGHAVDVRREHGTLVVSLDGKPPISPRAAMADIGFEFGKPFEPEAATKEAAAVSHEVEQARQDTETEPSTAQIEAGNYVAVPSPPAAEAPLITLSRSIADRLGWERPPISAKDLQGMAEKVFGGTLASGKFTRDQMYDALELGVNRHIAAHPELFDPNSPLHPDASVALRRLEIIKNSLPTQTVRAGQKEAFQQFSTPPDYAYVAARVAAIRPDDRVLEPSAGTGSLVAPAMNAHPAEMIVNELSANRAPLVESLGPTRAYRENAEQLNNILPADQERPSVVVMNPPFSQTAGRMGDKTVLMTGANHVDQALRRLEPGGRLVAIVGQGMRPYTGEAIGRRGEPTGAIFRDWWRRISQNYDVRANIGVPGDVYGKYGTNFGTRLLVIDKVPPAGRAPLMGEMESLPQAMEALDAIRQDRPEAAGQPVASQPGGEAVAGQRPPAVEPGSPLPRPTPVGGIREEPRVGRPGPEIPSGSRPGIGGISGPEARPGGGNEVVYGQPERPQPAGAEPNAPVGAGAGEVMGGGGAEPDGMVLRPEGGAGPVLPASGEPQGLAVEATAPVTVQADEAVADPEPHGEITESVYEPYEPQRIKVAGAKSHPGKLMQSAAMASIMPPLVDYAPRLPKELIDSGALSQAQLEPIVYAGYAHSQFLPNAEGEQAIRRGFFIGDGTGVGKGREIAGIILDNFQQGRRKAVWLSENKTLLNDALRDWTGLGQSPKDIFEVGKTKAGEDLKAGRGIGFLTYDTLKSAERAGKDAEGRTIQGRRRLDQLVDWLGKDFDGVIAFDESHNLANSVALRGARGVKAAVQKALAGIELQQKLPNARIVYLSATGATEVSNLAYAERLGLWGRGTAFPDKMEFINQIGSGGIAAMELVSRDMKAMGHYVSRNLSYDDVKYDRLEHRLTPEQRDIYDSLAEGWQSVLRNIEAALLLTGPPDERTGEPAADSNQRKNALSAFWGAHQRFFNQIITSMQMPTVIKGIEHDLAEGRQAVLQLVNTNEASQSRAIKKREAARGEGEEGLYDDLDLTPRDQLMQMIDKSFPTAQIETFVDENGNEQTREVRDSNGNIVHNLEALALKESLLDKVGSIRVPDGPLEMVLNHFGIDNVAEITGRKERVVQKPDKNGQIRAQKESRPASANETETTAFQNGKKKILIFSQAGGTGRSYHADINAPSSNSQRSHYLVQAGWRADKAIQGFGRTHRTNQASAPIFHLVTTDLQGQRRFISSIARRLSQLGALTKGERRAGESGLFGPKDNLESREADTALSSLWRDLQSRKVDVIEPRDFEDQTGLKLENDHGNPTDPPEITRFLNRLLSLKFDMQNKVFGEFEQRLNDAVDRAAANGTLDVGTETFKADKIAKDAEKTVYTDPKSGAETKYVRLTAEHRNHPATFSQVDAGRHRVVGHDEPQGYVVSKRSGKVLAVTDGGNITDAHTGRIIQQARLADPLNWSYVDRDRLFDDRFWEKIVNKAEAKKLWDAQVKALPEFRKEDVHLITGAILPIWDRLRGQPKVYRLQTDAGERMLGRVVHEQQIGGVLRALGAEEGAKQHTPEEVAKRLLRGDGATLVNGWKLKRSLVAGEPRIELVGPYYTHDAELSGDGLFKERIGYETRYFVPTGADAPKVLTKLLADHPISELASSAGTLEEPGRRFPAQGGAPRNTTDDFRDFRGSAADYVIARGRETGNEHAVLTDPLTGEVRSATTSDRDDRVRLPQDGSASGALVQHNHPLGTSLSASDLGTLIKDGVAAIVAHGHDGETYAAWLPRLSALGDDPEEAAVRLAIAHRMAANAADAAIRPSLRTEADRQAASHAFPDIVNRALATAGVIHYISSIDPRETMPDGLADKAYRAAIGALTGGRFKVGLDDRSAATVRPEDAVGRVQRAAAAIAAGRPGGAGGAGERGARPQQPAIGAGARAAELREESDPFGLISEAAERPEERAADLIPPGRIPPPGISQRFFRLFGSGRNSPGSDGSWFNAVERYVTAPSNAARYDLGGVSRQKYAAERKAEQRAESLQSRYVAALKPYLDLPLVAQRKINAVLELDRLQGIDRPLDGRPIVAENAGSYDDRMPGAHQPLAQNSRPGELIHLSDPREIAGFEAYRRGMDLPYDDLQRATAERWGWTGPPNASMIMAAAEAATGAQKRSLMHAARMVGLVEYARRTAYTPFMRDGDYYFRVTPKVGVPDRGNVPGWNGEGRPPTVWHDRIESQLPEDRFLGVHKPDLVNQHLEQLRRSFPEAEYDIEHGPHRPQEDAMRGLDINSIEDLFRFAGQDLRREWRDRIRAAPADARAHVAEEAKAAQDLHQRTVEALLDKFYEQMRAGFRQRSMNTPGYESDLLQSTGRYVGWIANHIADLENRGALDAADRAVDASPDPAARAYWHSWDRAHEGDDASRLQWSASRIRRGAFYWALGANAATTIKMLLHALMLGYPILSTGLNRISVGRAYLGALKDVLSTVRGDTENGITADLRRARLTPDEHRLVEENEANGRLHQQGAEEFGAIREQGIESLKPRQQLARRYLRIWASNIAAADRVLRAGMLLAAYRAARAPGAMDRINNVWQRDALWRNAAEKTPQKFAEFMVDRSVGVWGQANRSPAARSLMGGMLMQFRQYEINFLSTLWQASWHLGPAGKISALMMLGGLGMMAGATGLPFAQDIEDAYEGVYKMITGIDPDLEDHFVTLMQRHDPLGLGANAGATVLYGVEPFGVDLGPSLSFGQLASRGLQSPVDIAGAAASIFLGAPMNAYKREASGQSSAAVFAEMMPTAIKNLVRGFGVLPQEGVRTMSGATVVPPNQITLGEEQMQAAGLRPAKIGEAYREEERNYRIAEAHRDTQEAFNRRINGLFVSALFAEQQGDPQLAAAYRQQAGEAIRSAPPGIRFSRQSMLNAERQALNPRGAEIQRAPRVVRPQMAQPMYGQPPGQPPQPTP